MSWTCKYCKWLSNSHLRAAQMKGHFFRSWSPNIFPQPGQGNSTEWILKEDILIKRWFNPRGCL